MCLFGPDPMLLRWLRRWPPTPTLLSGDPSRLVCKPREEWDEDDLRAWVAFLEDSGARLHRDLRAAEAEVSALRLKLSRRKHVPLKPVPHGTGTLLTGGLLTHFPPKPKRGRRPSQDTRREAREVLAIRAELERGGGRVTDRQALEEWCARNGQRRSRALNNLRITNEISRIRREEAEWF